MRFSADITARWTTATVALSVCTPSTKEGRVSRPPARRSPSRRTCRTETRIEKSDRAFFHAPPPPPPIDGGGRRTGVAAPFFHSLEAGSIYHDYFVEPNRIPNFRTRESSSFQNTQVKIQQAFHFSGPKSMFNCHMGFQIPTTHGFFPNGEKI